MHRAPYFHLTFRPNIKLVSTVRRFIAEFYRRILVDQELSSRLALATHELLENAVAYATDEETEVLIEIEADVLSVKTWNRSSRERIASLAAGFDEMNAAVDADAFYQTMLIKTAKRADGSGLGLARIRAEAEMNLQYELVDDRVCILATAPIVGGLNP
jgi:anti-sigma regulatory factor (Ser/Thr protein kinase)